MTARGNWWSMAVIVVAATAVSDAAVAGTQMQQQKKSSSPTPPPTTSAPACADKVAVTASTVTPQAPAAGQPVTARMTIKNMCPAGGPALNIPWRMFGDANLAAQGTAANVAPGSSVEVSWTWGAATLGVHRFNGDADPSRTLGEAAAQTSNNLAQEVTINVPQPPQLETKYLNYQLAKNAGAQFPTNLAETTGCDVGVVDSNSSVFTCPDTSNLTLFQVMCVGRPTGARARQEAYKNFPLKNGWKIKSVTVTSVDDWGGSGWQWAHKPAEGSTDPFMDMSIWADKAGKVGVCVKTLVEGPAGTSPY